MGQHTAQTANRALLLASALIAAAAVTACGGGGGSDEPTGQTCVVRVQLLGDSTQASQFDSLQRYLDAYLGTGHVVVANQGVSGTVAIDAPPVDRGAISVANYGINDASRLTVEQYKDALRRINPSAFETPNPPIDQYAPAMREVAAELGRPVIDVSAYVRSLPGWEARVPDGIHPDSGLYAEITQRVVGPAVTSMVQAKECQS